MALVPAGWTDHGAGTHLPLTHTWGVLLWRHGTQMARMTRHSPRGTTRWLRLAPAPLRGYFSSAHTLRETLTTSLPLSGDMTEYRQSWGNERRHASSRRAGWKSTTSPSAKGSLRLLGDISRPAVKLRLRITTAEWLTLAKNKLKTHLYDTDFEQSAWNDILDDAWSLTISRRKTSNLCKNSQGPLPPSTGT